MTDKQSGKLDATDVIRKIRRAAGIVYPTNVKIASPSTEKPGTICLLYVSIIAYGRLLAPALHSASATLGIVLPSPLVILG